MKTRSQKSRLILKLFSLINLLSLIVACANEGSGNKQENKINEQLKLQPGKVIDEILCSQKPTYNYAIYLPSYYNPSKTFPVIIVFDAHARGKMAANRFVQAAEKFGYIVFASNNAKNGLKEIDDVVNALYTDVLAFPGVDKNRLYTAGFSGGAKVASSTAIYKGGIKGVIACAGGMPQTGQELSRKFDFAGVVGLNDFNYHEMKTLDKALSDNGFACQFFTFDGTHEWPSSDVLSQAVEWLELMAMKKKEIPLNDNLVRNYLASYSDSINRCVVSGLNYQAYLLYKIFLKDLDGLYDISDFQKSYEALLKNPEIDKRIKAEGKSNENEMAKQESLLNLFKSGNYSSIKSEISILKKNSSGKDEIIVHSSKRLLSFVGMLCYMYTENAVNSQNKAAFTSLIEIYTLVEPQNPDKEFYKACQAMMDNLPDKAFEYLQKAIDFGYYDAERLQVIGYFDQIRTKPEFDQLIKRAMENFDKQK
jgi:predicted esterase